MSLKFKVLFQIYVRKCWILLAATENVESIIRYYRISSQNITEVCNRADTEVKSISCYENSLFHSLSFPGDKIYVSTQQK